MEWDIDIKELSRLEAMGPGAVAVEESPLLMSALPTRIEGDHGPGLMDLLKSDTSLYQSIATAVGLKAGERILIGDQELQLDLEKHPDSAVVVFERNDVGEVSYRGVHASRMAYIQNATFGSSSSFMDEGSAEFKFDAAKVDEDFEFVPLQSILPR